MGDGVVAVGWGVNSWRARSFQAVRVYPLEQPGNISWHRHSAVSVGPIDINVYTQVLVACPIDLDLVQHLESVDEVHHGLLVGPHYREVIDD